jgi:hypothetical protein
MNAQMDTQCAQATLKGAWEADLACQDFKGVTAFRSRTPANYYFVERRAWSLTDPRLFS